MVNLPAAAHSTAIIGGFGRPTRLAEPVSPDTAKASLVIERDRRADEPVAASNWAFGDCRNVPFPGAPDPARLCLKPGFDPDAAYRLTYQGKDPRVLGIGFAATRDLIAYLRTHPDATGSAIRWAVGAGNSQSGNFLRSFVHLGFNADEAAACLAATSRSRAPGPNALPAAIRAPAWKNATPIMRALSPRSGPPPRAAWPMAGCCRTMPRGWLPRLNRATSCDNRRTPAQSAPRRLCGLFPLARIWVKDRRKVRDGAGKQGAARRRKGLRHAVGHLCRMFGHQPHGQCGAG